MKNGFVLLPVIFARLTLNPTIWARAIIATAGFCCASSAVYAFNDIADIDRDRLHPIKRTRPLPSGRLNPGTAAAISILLLILSVTAGLYVGPAATIALIGYISLQYIYSTILKHIVIIDVLCIAAGFVLRAVTGALAINVKVSPWLVLCTFMLCLFVGFGKRLCELSTLPENDNRHNYRLTLSGYNPVLLKILMAITGAANIVCFAFYATSPRTIREFGHFAFIYTIPLVVYALYRFGMQTASGRRSGPVDIMLHDLPFQITTLGWLGIVFLMSLPG